MCAFAYYNKSNKQLYNIYNNNNYQEVLLLVVVLA